MERLSHASENPFSRRMYPRGTNSSAGRSGSLRATAFSWNLPATGNVSRYSATLTSRPVGASPSTPGPQSNSVVSCRRPSAGPCISFHAWTPIEFGGIADHQITPWGASTRPMPVRGRNCLEGHLLPLEQTVRRFQIRPTFRDVRKATRRIADDLLGQMQQPVRTTLVAQVRLTELRCRLLQGATERVSGNDLVTHSDAAV